MSRIDRLGIIGVRSFDNNNPQGIKFYSPLTLIVGPNGSGKTTIIECLKYATTGALPPNSKGGAFVHDPNICSERAVQAQVKVKFRSTNQTRMTLCRSMDLTVKKNSRTFKTLDGTLKMESGGETSTLSSKVVELDRVMPTYLGVPKAILEHVIFCHQDDSLWPMSEPAPLKKKFDEIFEAQKYTKAIENLKDIKKGQDVRHKELQMHDKYAKETKARADRAEKDAQVLSHDIEQLRANILDFRARSNDASEKAAHARDQFYNFKGIVDKLNANRSNLAFIQTSMAQTKRNLVERTESYAELQSELENYEQRVKEREEQHVILKGKYADITSMLQEYDVQLSIKDKEQGKYEAMDAVHQDRLEKRGLMIQEESRRYHIRGFENSSDDRQIQQFMTRISKELTDRQSLVQKVRKETNAELKSAQESQNKLNEQRSSIAAEQKAAKQQIVTNEQKAKALRAEIAAMNVDEGEMVIADSKIEELSDRLQVAREKSRTAAWEQNILTHESQLRTLRDQVKQLNDELIDSTKHSRELAQQEHLQTEISDRERNLAKLKNVHQSKLLTLLDHQWDPSQVEADYNSALEQCDQRLKAAENKRAPISRELEQADSELARIRQAMVQGKQESDTCAKRIQEVFSCEPEYFLEELARAREDRDTLKSDMEGFGHLQNFYNSAIKVAEEKKKCQLCARGFDDSELKKFLHLMGKKLDKKGDIDKTKEQLSVVEDLLTNAQELGLAFETWQSKTKTEIPDLEKREEALSSNRLAVLRRLEEQDTSVNELEQAKADVTTIHKPVSNIARYHEELTDLARRLTDVKQKQRDAHLPRTLEEIQKQLDSVNEGSAAKSKAKDQLISERDETRTKISRLELELQDVKNSLERATYRMKDKDDKSKQIDELNKTTQALRQSMEELEHKMQDLAPQLEALQAKLDDIRSSGDQKEQKYRNELAQLERSVTQLSEVHATIRRYVDDGGPSALNRCREEIDRIKQEKGKHEKEKNEAIKAINKVGEDLRSQEETKRAISANIDYRDNLHRAEKLQEEIDELVSQNAEADRDQWETQAKQYENIQHSMNAETTSCIGEARAKDGELKKLLANYETEYRDAEQIARNSHIAVEATKAAIEDIVTYTKALDSAVMKFHGIKMQEINRIIEELWKKTYQGSDVDNILIRSDSENTKGNRTYNYRVCMVKSDVEMDMRGRCSAGQRVLASIIIRLALAECFGTNCGLIALDEPTTNLDMYNAAALARSLHELIQARRHQANFQLIVITHDEGFLKEMKSEAFCDNYWQIKRDRKDKTVIEMKDITYLM